MKYVRMMCTRCEGVGWFWGTILEHQKEGYAGGTDHITCALCDGTGFYRAEIIEEEDEEKDEG